MVSAKLNLKIRRSRPPTAATELSAQEQLLTKIPSFSALKGKLEVQPKQLK